MGIEDIVLDASAIVALVAKEKYGDWIDKHLKKYFRFHVLDLTAYEAMNAINDYRLRGEISRDKYYAINKQIAEFLSDCKRHPYDEIIDPALEITADAGIALYDSAYLALADKLGCRLLTVDINLYNRLEKSKELRELLMAPEHE